MPADAADAADEHRRVTRELLRRAHELAGIGTYELDLARATIHLSAEVVHLLRAGDRACSMPLDEYRRRFHHPDDRAAIVARAEAAYTAGVADTLELRAVRGDGEVIWVRASWALERNQAGEPVVAGMLLDITEQRRAEQSLRAGEALLRQFIEHTPAAVAMFDREMRYLHASARWLTDYRLDGVELIGRSHYDVFPDQPDRWRAIHQRVLAGAHERCAEDPFPRADGSLEWLAWDVQPWRDASGAIGGVIMFTQVISERKRAEARLLESEQRFRALSDNALVGIYVHQDLRITYVNPAIERMFGYGPGELIGQHPHVVIHPLDLPLAREITPRRIAGELDDVGHDVRGIRKDGRMIHVVLYAFAADIGGKRCVIGNIVDVSERHQLERQLRQAQKMEAIGVLAGGVAHDFNNLLTVILSYTRIVMDELAPGDPRRDDLAEVERAGQRAAQMTKQLLAFSRQQVTQPQLVDLHDVIAGCERMLRRLIGEHIQLTTAPAPSPARVYVDPGQLEQVLMNLVVNARDAMPDGGRLAIDVAHTTLAEPDAARGLAAGRHVVLSVTDTGTGMDEATRARIFEPFFTTKEVGKGTGLGLSTVFGIVRQSEGQMEVESELGRGTTFRIWLPFAAGEPAVAAGAARPAARGGETILLVEDEDAVRRVVRTMLVRHGYQVLDCRSGGDALVVSEGYAGPIDLLLTDVVMPLMSGEQLYQRLRASRPTMRVAFMSGYPDKVGAALPPDRLLTKPFVPDTLLHRLRELLA